MNNELKQKYLEEYTATELLVERHLIDSETYNVIEHNILRTVMGHFAIECNKSKQDCQRETSEANSSNQCNSVQLYIDKLKAKILTTFTTDWCDCSTSEMVKLIDSVLSEDNE